MRLNYIGRRTAIAMACIALIAVGMKAFGKNSILDDIARDASRYDLVRKLCPPFIALNNDVMPTIIESTLWVGVEKFGDKAMQSAVARQTERHTRDIRVAGIVQWCQQQRSILQADAVGRSALR